MTRTDRATMTPIDDTMMQRIQEMATTADGCMEQKTASDNTPFYGWKDDAPEWVINLIIDARDAYGPDAWRNQAIRHVLTAISEGCDEEGASQWLSTTTDEMELELLEWLGSGDWRRRALIDDVADEYGPTVVKTSSDLMGVIREACHREYENIFNIVWSTLLELVDVPDDEPDDGTDDD